MQKFTLEFNSDGDLYKSYMPFIKNGALFVHTTKPFELGTNIKLYVTLPNTIEPSEIIGKVSWVTPVGVQNGTPAGIGVSFIKDPDNIRSQIDKALEGLLSSSDPTFSM